jgi:SAM-dependent methyltransferase
VEIISLFERYLARAEQAAGEGDLKGCLYFLRALPLTDFGVLLFGLSDGEYPAITRVLPKMADEDVQRSWTGTSGMDNLKATVNFVQAVSYGFQAVTGRTLRNRRILDYGCGYGRMIRLMYHFSDPERICGCDPWERSIQICREDRLAGNLAISDYLPDALPFGETKFDLVYANSVFTHTSPRATANALKAIRKSIAEDGMLLITIRPVEFWEHYAKGNPKIDATLRAEQHRTAGYSFRPHNRAPIDGDITYGDASYSLDYIETEFPDWRIVRLDRTLDSAFQILTFLQPR